MFELAHSYAMFGRETGLMARLQLGTTILVVLAIFNKLHTAVFLVFHKSSLRVILLLRVSIVIRAFALVIPGIVALRRVLKLVNLGGVELVVLCLRLGMLE
jgi:hypothetical protein